MPNATAEKEKDNLLKVIAWLIILFKAAAWKVENNNDSDGNIYIGIRELNWKNRMYNHNVSCINDKYQNMYKNKQWNWYISHNKKGYNGKRWI